jgi:oxysterol-binding protein 1
MCWKLLKDLVGKDLSKFSLPVFLNEPTTILQKSAEMMFFTNFLTLASKE